MVGRGGSLVAIAVARENLGFGRELKLKRGEIEDRGS